MINFIKKFIRSSVFRFLISGGTATLIDLTIYYVLSNFIDITPSKLISITCASIFSFFINKKWTFSNDGKYSFWQILKYIIAVLINIGVNTAINTLLFNLTNIKFLAFVIATLVAMIVNYLLQKFFVFKNKKTSSVDTDNATKNNDSEDNK